MKKIFIISIVLILSACKPSNSVEKGVETTSNSQQEEINTTKNEVELNPFGNTVQKRDITDAHMLQYIHYMSYQKVQAERKWGFFLISEERIQWLLEALDEAYTSPDHKEKYREILTRWANGDFSKIDEDHRGCLKSPYKNSGGRKPLFVFFHLVLYF